MGNIETSLQITLEFPIVQLYLVSSKFELDGRGTYWHYPSTDQQPLVVTFLYCSKRYFHPSPLCPFSIKTNTRQATHVCSPLHCSALLLAPFANSSLHSNFPAPCAPLALLWTLNHSSTSSCGTVPPPPTMAGSISG